MAGFLAMGNDRYLGTYTAAEEMEVGVFVELDHNEKTGSLAGAGATDVYFVANENDTVDAQAIDTLEYRVPEGDFLRAHKPHSGEIIATTMIEEGLEEGQTVGITGNGLVGQAEGGQFVVKEMTGEYGVDTARLLVL